MFESITLELVAFLIFATLTLATAAMVIMSKDIMYSALFLAAFFISVAIIYIMLKTPFLAAVQVLVYVGGVAVMMIFVIFLVKNKEEKEKNEI